MKLEKYQFNPIIKPDPKHAFEDLVVCNPAAWHEDGTFYLLYRSAAKSSQYTGLTEGPGTTSFEPLLPS